MASYMLFIRGGAEAWAAMSPETMQQAMQHYIQWTDEMAASGKLVHAEQLAEAPTVLHGGSGAIVTDGPYTETKDLISGYYLYQAADHDEALAIARACPALQYGSAVVVYPVIARA